MKTVERLSYFSFYPADYLIDAADLSLLEHGAYLLLMIRYYWEGGLSESDRYRGCRTQEERTAVDTVLARFFHAEGDEIKHHRIERELARLAAFVEHQSKAGKASGAARAPKAKQTTAHTAKPRGNGELHLHAEFDAFWQLYPRKVSKGHALKAWAKVPEGAYAALLDALKAQIGQWDDPKFIPHPATWLNGRRWEDDVQAVAPTRDLGRCHYCANAATKLTNEIPHCDRLDHLDFAIARRM